MTARSEDRGDEAPDLMEALKDSVERAREKRRDREDRGVQVEARHEHIFEDCSCADDCGRQVCVLCELIVQEADR